MSYNPINVVRKIEIIPVIKATVVEGLGVEGSPVREVEYYSRQDGTIIARIDPCAPKEK